MELSSNNQLRKENSASSKLKFGKGSDFFPRKEQRKSLQLNAVRASHQDQLNINNVIENSGSVSGYNSNQNSNFSSSGTSSNNSGKSTDSTSSLERRKSEKSPTSIDSFGARIRSNSESFSKKTRHKSESRYFYYLFSLNLIKYEIKTKQF
jgi:hypothetical protein